jgi:hypothetical protein
LIPVVHWPCVPHFRNFSAHPQVWFGSAGPNSMQSGRPGTASTGIARGLASSDGIALAGPTLVPAFFPWHSRHWS